MHQNDVRAVNTMYDHNTVTNRNLWSRVTHGLRLQCFILLFINEGTNTISCTEQSVHSPTFTQPQPIVRQLELKI